MGAFRKVAAPAGERKRAMLGKLAIATTISGMTLMSVVGCGQTEFGAALDATLAQVERIRGDESLEPREKRDALAEFGIDAVTINGLLQAERLANQFGGDLSSAFEKVSNDRLSEMTPDEVQYYGDATEVTTYGDAEAQAIVALFVDNNLDSRADLEGFLDDPATEVPAAIDETNLREVFVDTSLEDVRAKLP
jgi:hypothetical protein